MVITQTQFHKAMEEINNSYAKLIKRVETLEEALKSQPKTTTTRKTTEKA